MRNDHAYFFLVNCVAANSRSVSPALAAVDALQHHSEDPSTPSAFLGRAPPAVPAPFSTLGTSQAHPSGMAFTSAMRAERHRAARHGAMEPAPSAAAATVRLPLQPWPAPRPAAVMAVEAAQPTPQPPSISSVVVQARAGPPMVSPRSPGSMDDATLQGRASYPVSGPGISESTVMSGRWPPSVP